MYRVVLGILLLAHGLIHLMGFMQAFQPGVTLQITKQISAPVGIVWLLTALLFLAAAGLKAFRSDYWWAPALLAVVASQILIIGAWADAKYGTLANVAILLACLVFMGNFFFERKFQKEVKAALEPTNMNAGDIITGEDLVHLPPAVQRYLQFAGVVGQPKVHNMRVVFEGTMRGRKQDWFSFHSLQYNTFNAPGRYFFMKGKMVGMEVPGYHRYAEGHASMDIRLFGLASLVFKKGPVMDQSETVTLFNDMCLMAPATLIDKRIQWKEIDSVTVEATYPVNDISITARLSFDQAGKLINFESHDRYEVNEMKKLPWLTPCSNYKKMNGVMLATKGEALYQYPDTTFTYGVFNLKSVQYNVQEFKK
jgi:hypothetical protein